jgi:hypothetical protein
MPVEGSIHLGSGTGGQRLMDMDGKDPADTLRVAYLDWCAARVAEHLLRLSPEEVWRRTAGLSRAGAPNSGVDVVPYDPSLIELARRFAHRFAAEIDLPPYAEWVSRFAEHPSRRERELLPSASPSPIPAAFPLPAPN